MDIYKNCTLANKPTHTGVEDGNWGLYLVDYFYFQGIKVK